MTDRIPRRAAPAAPPCRFPPAGRQRRHRATGLRTPAIAALLLVLTACGGDHAADDGHDHGPPAAAQAAGDRDGPAAPAGAPHSGEDGHDHADDDHDGRVTIPADIAEQVGIRVAPAAAGTIADQHEVQGLLTTLDNANARVAARFPGPVRRLHVELGDRVRAGQPLATIESNLSLSSYTVTAPIAGTVLAREAAVGQVVAEGGALYEIADLSRLWVDLHVFGRDAEHLAVGSPVTIRRLGDGASAETRIDRTLPGTATASQSTIARATLDNSDGQWRPGAAVRALVTVSLDEVALAVPLSALQEIAGRQVVFVREGDTYTARPVELGRRDAGRVEITAGLKAGEQVVVEQSYTVKADLGKAGAAHEH